MSCVASNASNELNDEPYLEPERSGSISVKAWFTTPFAERRKVMTATRQTV
jgi:hypothetical protein